MTIRSPAQSENLGQQRTGRRSRKRSPFRTPHRRSHRWVPPRTVAPRMRADSTRFHMGRQDCHKAVVAGESPSIRGADKFGARRRPAARSRRRLDSRHRRDRGYPNRKRLRTSARRNCRKVARLQVQRGGDVGSRVAATQAAPGLITKSRPDRHSQPAGMQVRKPLPHVSVPQTIPSPHSSLDEQYFA